MKTEIDSIGDNFITLRMLVNVPTDYTFIK